MKSYNVHEYFDHLKEKKIYKVEDKIGREDFHNALVSDKYGFTAEETNHLFDLLDANKDGYIDRNEWVAKVRSIHDPLFRIQDIIKTVTKEQNVKKGVVMRSLRAALMGDMHGPDLIQSWLILHQLGQDKPRLQQAIAHSSHSSLK